MRRWLYASITMKPGVDASYGHERMMLYEDDNTYDDFDAEAYDEEVNNELGAQEYAYDGAEDVPEDGIYDDEAHDDEYDDELEDVLEDEELSSSPSIPDENINFDLVYALHTFIATVEGQATVHKGDNLILLDDSNSYWWLVRVVTSHEVGYIPAENIETPYERLARLNKHRNVEITTATENDHDQVPQKIYSGHLIKARQRGVDVKSGKPSALSRREVDVRKAPNFVEKKRGVIFGKSEYLEHSDDDVSFEGDYDYGGEEYVDDAEPADEEPGDDEAAAAEAEAAEQAEAGHADVQPPSTRPVLGLFDPDDSLLQGLPSEHETRRQRPGSLLGVPGSVPTFNVVRVFAGENVESTATFKTVLLSKTTKATDLVRQAMQRFRVDEDPDEYSIVLKHIDGEERVLLADEFPLDILESLYEGEDADKAHSRDSVGSLSSLIDTSSQRVSFDYSDDRFGKLYIVHTASYTAAVEARPDESADAAEADRSVGGGSPMHASVRFTLQLALFPRDLPDGMVFHPKLGVAVPGDPATARMDRPQMRLLSFAKNATVAEVIESALSHFQVYEGVVDGGDQVDERVPAARRRSRVKYGLSVVTDQGERGLHAASKVLASYETPPLFKNVDAVSTRALKRGSLEMQQLLGAPEDICDTDPLVVLRQARTLQARTNAAQGEAQREGRAKQPTHSPVPSPAAAPAAAPHSPPVLAPPSVSPRRSPKSSLPHTPERSTGAVPESPTPASGSARPLADPNDQRGVDLILNDKMRLRSARTTDSPRIRYSLLQNGDEQDVSNVLRNVLEHKVSEPSAPPAPAPAQSDLLERFVDRMPDMSNASITDTIDLMLDRMSHVPKDTQSMEPLNKDIGGDTMPLFSAREADVEPPPEPPHSAQSQLSDHIIPLDLSYEPVMRTHVDLNALYGVVGAMAMVRTNTPITREHRRVLSTSSTASSHGWLQQSSTQLARLLDEPEEVKILEASNGLIGPEWPRAQHAPGSEIAAAQEKYAPLMSQVNMIEASLDDVLRTVLHID